MMETVGWIGSILLACCGIPSAVQAVRTKSCDVPLNLLLPWLAGEILVLVYNFKALSLPLFFNYGVNITCIAIMLHYRKKCDTL